MVDLAQRIARQEQLLDQVKTRVAMQIGRGMLAALDANQPGLATVTGFETADVLDGREFVSDYGLATRPHPGAEALIAYLAGLRSNGVVLRLFDRRYSISLEYGEVAIHDDLGQKVHLTRSGINVTTPLDLTATVGGNSTFQTTGTHRIEAASIELHASDHFRFDVNGHGQVWYPTKVDPWTIGADAGTTHPISPPEISA